MLIIDDLAKELLKLSNEKEEPPSFETFRQHCIDNNLPFPKGFDNGLIFMDQVTKKASELNK